jgi:hypothetical protein
MRKHWKEVELLRYRDGGFTQAHRFPFDIYATEILGSGIKADDAENILREQIPIYARSK